MEKLIIKEKVYVKEIKERLGRPGIMQFFMILRNDSYRGFDKRIAVQIPVKAEVKRTPVEYNDEDIQAAKAPSMMQAMMELQPQDDSDDEVSEDEATTTTQASGEQKAPETAESKKD